MNKYGFRDDFNWETRFDLKTSVGPFEVSTVDLGLDHSFGFGPPLYYETMIFLKENIGNYDIKSRKENHFEYYQERYSTEEEAIEGHKKAVELVKEYIGEK